VPSLTELVVDLGLREQLVARTGFSVQPADVLRDVPKEGGTKDVNLHKLRALAPTHVLVNVDENRLDTVEALRAFVPHVLVTHPCAPEDNRALLAQMADAFGALPGVRERAAALRARLDEGLAATQPEGRPARQVLYLIWRGPWMTVARDTYISRMLARVNWHTLPPQDGGERGAERYPVVDGDEAWLGEVDRVLLSSEPYRFGPQHVAAAQALCPSAAVQLVDGALLSWYGSRAVTGLRYLRELAEH
jgi:ABC-type Fe3+-hydroxamate transport system substrate-binding protein